MQLREINRLRSNDKVKKYASEILKECIDKGFSVADMKDLARILPCEISKAVIFAEEATKFSDDYGEH